MVNKHKNESKNSNNNNKTHLPMHLVCPKYHIELFSFPDLMQTPIPQIMKNKS